MVFGNLGLEQVEVKFASKKGTMPDGSYIGYISNARVVTKQDKNQALVLTYKIEDTDSEFDGQEIDEWRTFPRFIQEEDDDAPRFKEENDKRNATFLKQRLLTLGVKEDEIADLDLNQLTGIPVLFVVKTNNSYRNIRYVEVRENTIGNNTDLQNII